MLFSSGPITSTTGSLLCGITRTNGTTHFCCRKSDSQAVTAKTAIKNPKLHHDVGQFSRGLKSSPNEVNEIIEQLWDV